MGSHQRAHSGHEAVLRSRSPTERAASRQGSSRIASLTARFSPFSLSPFVAFSGSLFFLFFCPCIPPFYLFYSQFRPPFHHTTPCPHRNKTKKTGGGLPSSYPIHESAPAQIDSVFFFSFDLLHFDSWLSFPSHLPLESRGPCSSFTRRRGIKRVTIATRIPRRPHPEIGNILASLPPQTTLPPPSPTRKIKTKDFCGCQRKKKGTILSQPRLCIYFVLPPRLGVEWTGNGRVGRVKGVMAWRRGRWVEDCAVSF